MSLSSLQLDAFIAVVQNGSFSAAAKMLHIGQSALSQRIKALEVELQASLLVRNSKGAALTEAGSKLFEYCCQKNKLETEFVSQILSKKNELAGFLRVAGPSTLIAPIALHALQSLLKENPNVQLELHVRQMSELVEVLLKDRADFVLLDKPIERNGIHAELIGYEHYAMFATSHEQSRKDVFFDTFEGDPVTENFFRFHESKGETVPRFYRREYTGDVNVMVESVCLGLGCAILPFHFIPRGRKIKRVDHYKNLYKEPVYLNYKKQLFPSQLFKVASQVLREEGGRLLKMHRMD